jgi:hypothetical protein
VPFGARRSGFGRPSEPPPFEHTTDQEHGGRQASPGQQNPTPAHRAARRIETHALQRGRVDAIS